MAQKKHFSKILEKAQVIGISYYGHLDLSTNEKFTTEACLFITRSQKKKKTFIHCPRAQAMFPRCCLRRDYEENIFMVRRKSLVQTV